LRFSRFIVADSYITPLIIANSYITPLIFVILIREVARQMLVSKQNSFDRSWWEMAALDVLGGGLILAPNAKAAITHAVFARMLSRAAVNTLFPCLQQQSKRLTDELNASMTTTNMSVIDLQPHLLSLTFRVISHKVFGTMRDADVQMCNDAFRLVLKDAQNRVQWPFPRAQWLLQLLTRSGLFTELTTGKQAREKLRRFVLEQIVKCRSSDGEGYEGSVLRALLFDQSEKSASYFGNDDQIVDEIVTVLL
jgi:cytochrome P450